MSDAIKIQRAARDAKCGKWSDHTHNSPKRDYYDSHKHEKTDRVCEENIRLLWWAARKMARLYGCKPGELLGSVFLKLNQSLYSYDESRSRLGYFLMYRMRSYLERNFIRYESENRAIYAVARGASDEDIRTLQRNYAFHEMSYQLYRMPEEDDDWAQEIISNFDSPAQCFNFLTSDLDRRTKEIIRGRFNGKTLREMAGEHGVTKQRIDQIFQKGMEKLRDKFGRLQAWVHLFDKGHRT